MRGGTMKRRVLLALVAAVTCAIGAGTAGAGPRDITPRAGLPPVSMASLSPAPATSSGWLSTAAVTVTLTATDPDSAVDYIQYRLLPGAAWTRYSVPVVVSAEGATTLQHRARDTDGSYSAAKSITVRIDRTPPVTTAGPVPSNWVNRMVGVALYASDALAGLSAGGARTEYSSDGGATWTSGDAASVRAEGKTRLLFRSVDAAGNVEASKGVTVRIDSREPVTMAYPAKVKRGRKVRLGYRITDARPGCGKAKVTLQVRKGSRRVKTITVAGQVPTNVKRSVSWRCTLRKGTYSIRVYAKDIAGNAASTIGSATLTVK